MIDLERRQRGKVTRSSRDNLRDWIACAADLIPIGSVLRSRGTTSVRPASALDGLPADDSARRATSLLATAPAMSTLMLDETLICWTSGLPGKCQATVKLPAETLRHPGRDSTGRLSCAGCRCSRSKSAVAVVYGHRTSRGAGGRSVCWRDRQPISENDWSPRQQQSATERFVTFFSRVGVHQEEFSGGSWASRRCAP